ncbi:MAG: hypothetical protein AB1651_16060 [Pseudomonadota bacterium]
MRYKTVAEILDFIRAFHARAARLLDAAADQAQQERARLLLQWLADHERRFAQAMGEFEAEPGNETLLKEWMQYMPEFERIPLQLPQIEPDLTVDDALALAVAFDEYLVKLYQAVIANCGYRQLCDMFKKLLDQERAEERVTARSVAFLHDM